MIIEKDLAEISSAELTAQTRSGVPALSGDPDSLLLASPAGKAKTQAFMDEFDYGLMPRLVSTRAGYMLGEATRLLESGKYDACISFASGFSLLLYQIAKRLSSADQIQFFDTDLASMIDVRRDRITAVQQQLDVSVLQQIKTLAVNIEQNYQQKRQLRDLFPQCQRPVFVLEGIIYFLSEDCAHWLFEQIGSFSQSALLMDYWPLHVKDSSALATRIFSHWDEIMPEKSQNRYLNDFAMKTLSKQFSQVNDIAIEAAEVVLCEQAKETPQLLDKDKFFPMHLLTAEVTTRPR